MCDNKPTMLASAPVRLVVDGEMDDRDTWIDFALCPDHENELVWGRLMPWQRFRPKDKTSIAADRPCEAEEFEKWVEKVTKK